MAQPSVLDQLARYGPQERPGAVVHALRQLARRAGRDLVLIARLAHEAHAGAYWSQVKRRDGDPYLSEEEFFADVLDTVSWRTALKRVALGRAIAALPEAEREGVANQLADLGAARATVLVPILEAHAAEPAAVASWIERAATVPAEDLQKIVSDEVGAQRRGRGDGTDRVEAFLRSVMPSVEARELFEEFITLGRRVTNSQTVLGILIAAMQECVATWAPKP